MNWVGSVFLQQEVAKNTIMNLFHKANAIL